MGKGLFDRGLHFSGIVTPGGVRNVCLCDYCQESFTIQHIHAGFSEVQYFYSADGKQTLLVRYNEIENIPRQLGKDIDPHLLKQIESKLPDHDKSIFKYYNPLRCPHCSKPYIDFDANRDIRPKEYYANKLINDSFLYLSDF